MNKQGTNKPEPCKGEINKSDINLQQLLLDVIWSDESSEIEQSNFDVKGINIYKRNLFANAKRALSISFPTIFKLLDSNVSENLVEQFLKISPPEHGDWAQWGKRFSHFLVTTDVGRDYPYLADCATVDWHIHSALNGIDQVFLETSLQVLSDNDPRHIFIEFNKNVALFHTAYPVADIFHAHNSDDEHQRTAAMIKAKKALACDLREQVVMIFRPEFQPKISNLKDSDALFMTCLFAGQSLDQALDAVKDDNDFSFQQWLINALNQNLIFTFKEKKL